MPPSIGGNPGWSEAVTTPKLAYRLIRDLLGKKKSRFWGRIFLFSQKWNITVESLFLVALLVFSIILSFPLVMILELSKPSDKPEARQKRQPRDLTPLAAEPTMALQLVMHICG